MKSVISALLIFIFIIVGSFASYRYVNDVIDEMLQSLYKNEISISKNFWDESKNETKNLEELWQKNRAVMSVIFNHTVIDKIDTSIAEIKNAVQMREKGDFIYEKSNMELMLLNLKEQQKINAENVF